MAKLNINFDNKDYLIEDSALSSAAAALRSHLQTNMSGSGATINLGGVSYNVDSTKLSTATSNFVTYLGTIAGTGCKVTVNGVEYNVDSTKMANAFSNMHDTLTKLQTTGDDSGETDESETYTAGLYQTGAIALYNEQGAEAIDGMMIKSWDELLAEGVVCVEDGVVSTPFDEDEWVNLSADALAGDLMLPYDGSVTIIGEIAFNNCTNLTGIAIPDSVTEIGNDAFCCCALTSIDIPSNVTSIGDYAFDSCESMTSVTFGENSQLTTIGESAFNYCYSLTSVEIPLGVTSIGNRAFCECTGLTSVGSVGSGASIEIPNGVTSWNSNIFGFCTGLTSVTIPDSVTAIEYGAFYGCTGLTSVGSVGSGASIEIPNGVTSISGDTFRECENLTSVVIPNSVTSIGDGAFQTCTSLTNVVIPKGITTIGRQAFLYCTNLTSITFEGTMAQWNEITKGDGWNNDVPATKVVCSDGFVYLIAPTSYHDAVYWNPNTGLAGVGFVFNEDNTITVMGYMDDDRFMASATENGHTYDPASYVIAEDFSTITDSDGQLLYRSHEVEGVKYNEEYINETILDGEVGVTSITISDSGISHAKQYYRNAGTVIMEQDFPVEVTNDGLFVKLMGKIIGSVSSDGDYIWMNAYASDAYPNTGEMFVRKGAVSDSEIPFGQQRIIGNYLYSYKCKYNGETWIPYSDSGCWGVKAYNSSANPDEILDSIDGIPVTDIYNNGMYA